MGLFLYDILHLDTNEHLMNYIPSHYLPSESHLRTREMPQPTHVPLVLYGFPVPVHAVGSTPRAIHFRESDLPWRVPIQLEVGAEHQQQIWLRLEDGVSACSEGLGSDVADFSVDQLWCDIFWGELAVLAHFCQGFGQIDDGFPAISR